MRAPSAALVLFSDNQARDVRAALEALCAQTRPAEQIIVIDDGSTDDSPAILAEVAARRPDVTLVRHDHHLGPAASMAEALGLVTADYLVWTTADDRLLPRFLERSMAALERHPEAGLCVSELAILEGDSDEIVRLAAVPGLEPVFGLSDLPEYLAPGAVQSRMQRAYLPIGSSAVVVRSEALRAVGGYPAEIECRPETFAATVLALRFGACVVADTLALRRVDAGAWVNGGMRDPARPPETIGPLLGLLAQPRYRDVRRAFRRCPSNFFPFSGQRIPFQRRDWDLVLAYRAWNYRQNRREDGFSTTMMLAKLGVGLFRPTREWLRRPLRALARRVRDALGTARSVRHAVGLMSGALRKYQQRRSGRETHLVAAVGGPVTQDVVRSMIVWQLGLPRNRSLPVPRGVHGELRVASDVQLDRLFSLLCVSGTFESFSIVFDEPEGVDLGAARSLALTAADRAGLARAFLPLTDGRRTATSFLKIAHPRAFVVALSLAEDDDGFADEALSKWLPHLQGFRRAVPGVAFCLLNRTMMSRDHEVPLPADVSPVRSLGFALADAVALAQIADAFVGRLDAFGLAAVAAQRPGVFVDPAGSDRADAERSAWFFAEASPEQCLDVLRSLLRERRRPPPML